MVLMIIMIMVFTYLNNYIKNCCLYYDLKCAEGAVSRITVGFVFRMNFAMQATAIYQYCLHIKVFHITAHIVVLCEVRTECIADTHIHHPEKFALRLPSTGISQKSQMHSDAWRY